MLRQRDMRAVRRRDYCRRYAKLHILIGRLVRLARGGVQRAAEDSGRVQRAWA